MTVGLGFSLGVYGHDVGLDFARNGMSSKVQGCNNAWNLKPSTPQPTQLVLIRIRRLHKTIKSGKHEIPQPETKQGESPNPEGRRKVGNAEVMVTRSILNPKLSQLPNVGTCCLYWGSFKGVYKGYYKGSISPGFLNQVPTLRLPKDRYSLQKKRSLLLWCRARGNG